MINRTQQMILRMLTDPKGTRGLDLVRNSNGKIKRGTVYVTLQGMEEMGLIESWEDDAPEGESGPKRRLYRIAAPGSEALEAI